VAKLSTAAGAQASGGRLKAAEERADRHEQEGAAAKQEVAALKEKLTGVQVELVQANEMYAKLLDCMNA